MAKKQAGPDSDPPEAPVEDKAAAKKAAKEKKAQEKKDKKNKKAKEKKGGLLGKLLITVIFLGIIGLLVGIIGFNFLGLRERYLRGIIDRIPIVNSLLPAPEAATGDGDAAQSMSNAELLAEVDRLQKELDTANTDKQNLQGRIDLYTSELDSLRAVAAQQEQFKQDKAAFDDLIAKNDPSAYAKFYESISPENADTLYREVIGQVQQAKDWSKYVGMISSMDEKSAAKMLESLLTPDMDLVVQILKNISSDTSGAILDAMSADNSAAVVKRMAPVEG